MSKSRKVSVVDGYTALKAAQHAVKTTDRAEPAAPQDTNQQPPSELQKLGAHVTRTAVPAKRVIECYECGYKFQLHGRAPATNCSKCRATIDLGDYVIDRKWNGPLRTAGTIRISADGVVETGDLVANDIILEGTLEAGTARAMRKLELLPNARFSEANIHTPDLIIAASATIAFMEPAEFRNVEVFGTLRAALHASGVVIVRSGGLLQGEILSSHLVIEDGGGLLATAHIEPIAQPSV